MAMREAVAVDFMGVGREQAEGSGSGGGGSGSEERVRLVRPIPSGGQARRSPAAEGGRESGHGHPFASAGGGGRLYGLRQHAWNRVPSAGRPYQAGEENASSKAIVAPKMERESTDGPLNAHPAALPQWDKSDAAGNAGRYDPFLQARKVAAMYAGHQQAARGMQNAAARTTQFRDEVMRAAAQPGSEHVATQPQPPANQGGFGSPTPFYGRPRQASGSENGAAAVTGSKRPPIQQHAFQAGNAHGLARPAGPGKQPRAAQLTIFYAGMVNVYDDVPYDKAQAIMLLAGSGSTWSSNYMNPPASAAPARPSAPMAVPLSTASTPATPAPQAPTTSAAAPPRPVIPVVFSNVRPAPVQNVELPQARKASLARFLEKRKDRVRKVPVKEDGEASPSRGGSPGPSAGQPATRSPSPSQASAGGTAPVQDHRSSAGGGGPRHQAGASSCSEQGSPTRPPGTPPRQSVSEERSGGTPKRRDYESETQHANKRARNGRSPRRLGGESQPDHALHDDDSSSR